MKLARAFFACSLLATATNAVAGVSKISSPTVTKGKASIEYSGTRNDDDKGSKGDNKQKHRVDLEYGLTDNLKIGIEGNFERQRKDPTELKTYGVEAQYEFTEQGQWWLSSALKLEYTLAVLDSDADEIELKWIAARRIEDTSLLSNVTFGRELGSNREGGISVNTKLQAVQRITPYANPGLEWHGDFGTISNFASEESNEHYVGPIVTGDIANIAGGTIDYTAGYYWGIGNQATDEAARVQISYEIKF